MKMNWVWHKDKGWLMNEEKITNICALNLLARLADEFDADAALVADAESMIETQKYWET